MAGTSILAKNSTTKKKSSKSDEVKNSIFSNIFKYMEIDDIFKCQYVSDQFFEAVRLYEITELSFLDDINDDHVKYENLKDKWFSTNESVKLRNQLRWSSMYLLNNPTIELITNLKRLRIGPLLTVDLEDLNRFDRLEILEVQGTIISTNKGLMRSHELNTLPTDVLLQLPELKAFSIASIDFKGTDYLFLDTPNLKSIDNLRNIKIAFENPLTITYIRVSNYHASYTMFRNLEILELFETGNLKMQWIDEGDILEFRNLKKLSIVSSSNDVDKIKSLFRLKKYDLEIFLFGVRIKSIYKINEFIATKNKLMFQLAMNNYNELQNNLYFLKCMWYDNFLNLLPTDQPADLFDKFTNIQRLIVSRRVDENRLINFIRECTNLYDLEIERASLSQEFYDRLPAINLLCYLKVYEYKIDLNFEFIMKMHRLIAFETNREVSIDEKMNLNKLKHFKVIKFKIGDQIILVRKNGENRFTVSYPKNLIVPDQSYFVFDELIELCIFLKENCSKKKKNDVVIVI